MIRADVVVRGDGQASAMPDLAVVWLTVEADADSGQEAYARASVACEAVDAVLADHADAIERLMTASLVLAPLSRYRQGAWGYRARRTTSLDVTNFDALGRLLAQVVDAGGTPDGLSWQLRPSNPVFDEARCRAAEQARAKAETYASALGLHLGQVVWIADPGIQSAVTPTRPGRPERYLGPAVPLAADMPMEVSSGPMTVSAALEVGFSLAR